MDLEEECQSQKGSMKILKVIVVYKKTTYQKYIIEAKDPLYTKLLKEKHPTTKRFQQAHENHEKSLKTVQEILEKRNIEAKFVHRAKAFDEKAFDLVITVGGDGTFLDASRCVLHKTIVGINSSPKDSVGRFCLIQAHQLNSFLDQLEAKKTKLVLLSRLKVELDDHLLSPVLNDVLICNKNPATTSRYLIQMGKKREEHKSSGIWVSTAAGSTAAISGAGGVVLDIEDRRFQFLVREPYRQPSYVPTLVNAVLDPQQILNIYSKMREGVLFLDGSRRKEMFSFGSKLKISAQAPKLKTWNLKQF